MSDRVWIDPDVLLAAHDEQLQEHGGATGIRDRGLFESALARPQNLAAYGEPGVAALAASYGFGLAKNHPFVDGNGRSGRLLLNFELMKAGYPPAIIQKEDRLAYYDSLDEACVSGDYSSITQLVANSVQRSLDTYLSVLGLRN